MTDLDEYFGSQIVPRPRYGGQLEPEFQAALARRYDASDASECVFAQTVELPDGTLLQGAGDFRGSEPAHLGTCKIEGKRVVEFGAGSGWLTAFLAHQGATVTSLELPVGTEVLGSPFAGLAPASQLDALRQGTERARKAWWLVKQRCGFDAKIVYCDLEAPPDDLGRFDVSIFAATLLRLPNPYMALSAAAAITDDAIVVTEPVTPLTQNNEMSLPIATFAPDLGPETASHWWHHTPAALSRMLLTLGFGKLDMEVHTAPRSSVAFYTITARRVAA